MFPWAFLIDDAAFATVLPDAYAHYRQPIQGALATFLEGLPAGRQAAILRDQAGLAATASHSERLARLARSCPVLHKLGQVLARDRRLSAELRQHLQQLESLPPATDLSTVERRLISELGPLDRLGVTLEPPAIAEASVAVVIPFRQQRAGRNGGLDRGVFKILKPDIEDRLEQELQLLGRVGAYLDQRCDDFDIPHLDYQDSFAQVADKLRHEIRLDLEQQHLAQARAVYQGESRVQIPALLEHCTPRVTAMQRVVGSKVTEHRLPSETAVRRLAEVVVAALIAQPLFSVADRAMFHADPHAGNLQLTADHRLAILDWSLVGSLRERQRTAIVQIVLSAMTLNAPRILALLTSLSERGRADGPALEGVVRQRLQRIRQGQFPGFAWLMGMLDEAVQTARLRVSADLMLFRKSLYTLEGVLADITAGVSYIDRVLLGLFLRHFSTEWRRRWVTPVDSRVFATQLSNGDLTQLLLSVPWTATRYWLDQSADLLTCPAL